MRRVRRSRVANQKGTMRRIASKARVMEEEKAELHLLLPLRVPFRQVLIAGEHFLRMSQSVAQEIVSDVVTWVFDDFKDGSLDLILKPEPDSLELAPKMPTVVHAIVQGVRTVEREPTRPPFFTDAALYHAKNLAKLDGVRIKNATAGSELTHALRNNVDRIVGPDDEEWGTVEGRVESLTVHRKRAFNLYEPISGDRIECSFGRRIPADEIGNAVEKRVAVSGKIVYRGDKIVHVLAEEIEVFPSDDQLPTIEDVLGILADRPNGGQ